MFNPHAIYVRTDAATKLSDSFGGIGIQIQFPDDLNLEEIHKSYKVENQNIHRLEQLGIIEGIKELLRFSEKNIHKLRSVKQVILNSDRFSLSDEELNNPGRVAQWKKQGWKNKDGISIKNRDIIKELERQKKKLSKTLGCIVKVEYLRRKKNRVADKLSKRAAKEGVPIYSHFKSSPVKVSRKLYSGEEIKYSTLNVGDTLKLHIYNKDRVNDQYQLLCESVDFNFFGKKVKVLSSVEFEDKVHRQHFYEFVVKKVYAYMIEVEEDFVELDKSRFVKNNI